MEACCAAWRSPPASALCLSPIFRPSPRRCPASRSCPGSALPRLAAPRVPSSTGSIGRSAKSSSCRIFVTSLRSSATSRYHPRPSRCRTTSSVTRPAGAASWISRASRNIELSAVASDRHWSMRGHVRAAELRSRLLRVRGVGANRDRERAIVAQRLAHDFGVAMQPAQAGTICRIEDEVERHPPRGEPPLDLDGKVVEPLPASRRDQHRMPPDGLAFGAIARADATVAIEPIDLVPNLDQPRAVLNCDAELGQDLFDVDRLRFGVLV